MAFAPYRAVLAVPGVRSLTVLILLARIPFTASAVVLTLHVVLDLGLGYGAAGVAGAAVTVGYAVGAPLKGRLADRHGIRSVLAICTVGSTAFWSTAALLPYPVLLVVAVPGGILGIPSFSISRQALTALVPEPQRRVALSLDSITAELSFVIGPAAGVIIATTASATIALTAVGAGTTIAGICLYSTDPPTRSAAENLNATPAHRRDWLTLPLLGQLLTAAGTTLALSGMDVGIVATLRRAGELDWVGVVNAVACAASVIGGLGFGLLRRHVSARITAALLGALMLPLGVATGHWWLLTLALLPASSLCAPTMTTIGDELSRLAPPAVRGLVMGLQGSAFTIGSAIGAPLAGAVADRSSAGWGFAAVGAVAVVLAAVATPLNHRQPRRAAEPALAAP